ncbi:MAG TPA: hypothetical protein PL070_00820 [Flavobacteriales bacterium]|nr:hypothetical protein [Flavobacteriales bacterium]
MVSSTATGLPKGWAYSPTFDLELKQYVLLGYLQRVKARFGEQKLYPYLTDVRREVDELVDLQRTKEDLIRSLRGDAIGFDPANGRVIRALPEAPEPLQVVDEVIDFAIPQLQRLLDVGSELRREIAQHIHFSPVGLEPLHMTEGWLFLRLGREARVYAYTMPLLVERDEHRRHQNIFTRYVTTYTVGLVNTFEHIKAELIRTHPHLPNPSTYAVETELALPRIETLMPLAKHLVHAHVMARA